MIVKLFNVVLIMSNIISGDGYPITRNSFLNGISKYANSMINMVNDDNLQPDYLEKKTQITTDFKLDSEEDTEAQSELKIVKDDLSPLIINYYGTVSTESCLALTTMLRNLDVKSKELELKYDHRIPIKLHIQSMGGELMPTFYVCDLIRKMDTPVHVYIDGYVASAAATIAVCGHKRYITKHSSMLIHQLKSSSSGKFAELKDEMSNLNMFMMNLEDIYLENTNINKEELEKLLFSEVWLSADKCLEYGLVDKII